MSDTKHTPPYPMPFNWPEVDAVTYSTPEAAEQAMKRMAEWQATYDALLAALEAALAILGDEGTTKNGPIRRAYQIIEAALALAEKGKPCSE